MTAENIAQAFHETYERLAPDHGYETREASAKPWDQVPEQNKSLMIAVVDSLLAEGIISEEGWVDGETALPSLIPAVGDRVHYVSYGTPGGEYPSVCRAAIVTAVDTYQDGEGGGGLHVGHVSLAVLNPEGLFFNRAVLQDEMSEEPRGGTWHWPECTA